jgi:small subunit ribosomal protein S20
VANHPSAKKRTRQRAKRRAGNRVALGSMRAALKNARAALAQSGASADSRAKAVKSATQVIDAAVSKGIVKRQTASRTISRLVRAANKAAQG